MKFLGQDISTLQNQLIALALNLYDWCLQYVPQWTQPKRIAHPVTDAVCIAIHRPGGLGQLQFCDIVGGLATVGYNVPEFKSPFVNFNTVPAGIPNKISKSFCDTNFPPSLVLVKTDYFSINYADVCIRWGLYESALQYVGWPIVPGFDFSGTVLWAGSETQYSVGDKIFGFTMFGAYSSRILVPASQIRRIPRNVDGAVAAALPAVAGTALHAIHLAGAWPCKLKTRCTAALIHSAAGGVGSMLIQMCKLCGFSPVVAVVGAAHKVEICKRLGADVVIDKSAFLNKSDLNAAILAASVSRSRFDCEEHNLKGYIAVFDANGVESLQHSYDQLSRCGRVVAYGFHSNLPRGAHALSPYRWVRMILDLAAMPKFDPMAMVLESKAVLGFNLSFFADEHGLIAEYMTQLDTWLAEGSLQMAEVTVFDMKDVSKAHQLIQSGQSVGKIVMRCPSSN